MGSATGVVTHVCFSTLCVTVPSSSPSFHSAPSCAVIACWRCVRNVHGLCPTAVPTHSIMPDAMVARASNNQSKQTIGQEEGQRTSHRFDGTTFLQRAPADSLSLALFRSLPLPCLCCCLTLFSLSVVDEDDEEDGGFEEITNFERTLHYCRCHFGMWGMHGGSNELNFVVVFLFSATF